MDIFSWLNTPAFELLGRPVPYSDLFGNVFALLTVVLALRRNILSWPVQILGSILLFSASMSAGLGGNASRQVVIVAAAIWGWTQWRKSKAESGSVTVRWASRKERVLLIVALLAGTALFASILHIWNLSWSPIPDAYIFIGSLVAMYAQGRAIVEFWFVWLAVDLVGIPLAVSGGLVFSGAVYLIFLVMVIIGLRDWARRSRQTASSPYASASDLRAP
ncbi:nicotinamide mononucleotide transporter family protein [Saxibacter everestensis]|uniref:Nicotinamide mononucleotide transporter family protein n=1 Tax=Saxibacter everestensis TaxID=2909229 RepID=A0ABY8QZK6_9MICO|nr:nicotinamide mononucleotide transporter family protein [Brevibacteriaceae bacterium ZFBP1038]